MANLDNTLAFSPTMDKLTVTDPVTADDNADKSINKYLEQLFSNDSYLKENAVANAWKPTTPYEAGDVAYSKNARTFMRFDCLVGGVSGATEPGWNAAGLGATIVDGTCQWRIHDVKDSLPVGAIIAFPMSAIPAGYLICNGQAVGRATYPELFTAIGTTYGTGNGTTTFNLPDYRSVFLRGLDSGRGIDAGRALGSYQDDAMQGHFHLERVGANTINANSDSPTSYRAGRTAGGSGTSTTSDTQYNTVSIKDPITDGTNGTPRTATETRAKNVSVVFCIKAFGAIANPGIVDITQLANDMAGKVNLSDFAGTNQNKAASGWQKLPGGLILQWGSANATSGSTNVTFPIAFSNNAFMVIASASNPNYSTAAETLTTGSLTQTGFLVVGYQNNSGASIGRFDWFAIGH